MLYISSNISDHDCNVNHYAKWSIRDYAPRTPITIGCCGGVGVEKSCVVNLSDVSGKEVLGIGMSSIFSWHVAIKHTNKTATLHKYIDRSSTEVRNPSNWVLDADIHVFDMRGMRGYTDDAGRDLFISIEPGMLDIFGFRGSCVVYDKGINDPDFMTLYDFLGMVCKKSGVNIFCFRDLVFYSVPRGQVSTIRLSGSVEAKRFYTKMYMDVMR